MEQALKALIGLFLRPSARICIIPCDGPSAIDTVRLYLVNQKEEIAGLNAFQTSQIIVTSGHEGPLVERAFLDPEQ